MEDVPLRLGKALDYSKALEISLLLLYVSDTNLFVIRLKEKKLIKEKMNESI